MKQDRLEALKLAVSCGVSNPHDILFVAEEFASYIEHGPKVVELPSEELKPRRKRRTRQEMEDDRASQSH